jgi:hypothetical protein
VRATVGAGRERIADVVHGQRLRGPADTDITTYATVSDGGQLYLLVPEK